MASGWQAGLILREGNVPLDVGRSRPAGCILVVNARHTGALTVVSNVLVASLLTGVARAWELVGDRDTGITSIAALAGRERHLGGFLGHPPSPASGPAEQDSVAGPDHPADLPGHERRGWAAAR
jgi:hypothetical protein